MLGSQWDVCIPLINRPYEKSHIALVPISHNAPVQYPTMCHFVTEMCIYVHISVTKWCIVGYLSGALWDFWSETGLFCMKFRAWSHYWSIIYSQIMCHWRGPRWPCIYNIFHIYIYESVNKIINGSCDGFSPVLSQTIIWTNADLLSIEYIDTNFSDIFI